MADRLDSWKEVAAYLRRGARTVQRWEREEGLPVHRLRHEKLGSVYAYKSELDAWWQSRRDTLESEAPVRPDSEASVAVLPFADMSREKDQEYFCEGIAEEIIGALSRIEGLHVASRTSAFRFKPGATDVREAGRQLRVRNLLEGSVRKNEGRLRISVQLAETATGYQVWSQTYDRTATDVLTLQSEIAGNVARALRVALTPKEKAELARSPTKDADAYDYYLRGRKFFYGYGPRDIEFAIQMFARAVASDPDFALAYAGLADCWCYIYLHGTRADAVREQACWASARALELDPGCAPAHASQGMSLSLGGRDEEAVASFEKAIALDPGSFEAHYFYARHCFGRGDKEKALELYEGAMRIRPEDYQSPLLAAQSYDDLGRPEQAAAARRRGIAAAERHLEFNPDDVRALYMAANGMAALGDRQRAAQWAERALALRPDDSMALYNIACIYSLLGMCEPALACLESSVKFGMHHRGWLEHDSNLDPLRSNLRFQALLAALS
jgi:TolB-like protein/Flp pilus assembly protein TadD